jgi:shikimate dehydrogenase
MTVTGKARLAGVLGWPVSHSRSPVLHNFWLAKYGIDGAYVPLAVRPEDLADAVRALAKLGFAGANVTVPHKEAALRLVDDADSTARRVGAVNTIIVQRGGRLAGRNSDVFGFLAALDARTPDWRAAFGAAVVLGAGGAARAIVAALQDAGAREIRVVNRTRSRAEALARDFGSTTRAGAWEERGQALSGATILVNATTLGMAGSPPLDLPLDALPKGAIVADIVYVPLRTPLLHDAAKRGNRTVDGLEMLLHQARPGFEAWFGRAPEVTDDLRRHVLADLGAADGH